MKINPKIRFATHKDIQQIIQLCELHAHFEKSAYSKTGKSENLALALFSNKPKLYCLVVESDTEIIAYSTYMEQYATWDAAAYIYMDCIYVKEFARGRNIGEKLVEKIKEEGRKLGCNHIQWQTPDFNVRAIKFYNRIGAVSKSKERFSLNINTLANIQ